MEIVVFINHWLIESNILMNKNTKENKNNNFVIYFTCIEGSPFIELCSCIEMPFIKTTATALKLTCPNRINRLFFLRESCVGKIYKFIQKEITNTIPYTYKIYN